MNKTLHLLFILLLFSFGSNAQNWKWAIRAGGSYYDYGNCITTDNFHNVYVVGNFNSPSMTIASIRLTNADSSFPGTPSDIFIAKLDSSGNVLWAQRVGITGNEAAKAVATDNSGNVYVAGYFNSPSITFGTTTLINSNPGTYDVFVTKYDPLGNSVWATSFGGNGSKNVTGIVTDSSNKIYLTGYFSGSIIVGSIYLNSISSNDMYLMKMDSNGLIQWAKRAGGNRSDVATCLATDRLGNVFVAGYFNSYKIFFDTAVLTNYSPFDSAYRTFLVKYNSAGEVIWIRNSVDPNYINVQASSVCVDRHNNIYTSGANGENIFLTKHDQSGNILFAKGSSGSEGAGNTAITTDAYDNVYLLCTYWSFTQIHFDSLSITPTIGLYEDVCLVRYDSVGKAQWVENIGNNGPDGAASITTDKLNNVYVMGRFHGDSLCFDSITLKNYTGNYAYRSDVFLAKLSGQYIAPPKDTTIIDIPTSLSFFPNPVENKLTISAGYKITNATITNTLGCIIFAREYDNEKVEIYVGEFPKGVYFIKINGTVMFKFVKL